MKKIICVVGTMLLFFLLSGFSIELVPLGEGIAPHSEKDQHVRLKIVDDEGNINYLNADIPIGVDSNKYIVDRSEYYYLKMYKNKYDIPNEINDKIMLDTWLENNKDLSVKPQ